MLGSGDTKAKNQTKPKHKPAQGAYVLHWVEVGLPKTSTHWPEFSPFGQHGGCLIPSFTGLPFTRWKGVWVHHPYRLIQDKGPPAVLQWALYFRLAAMKNIRSSLLPMMRRSLMASGCLALSAMTTLLPSMPSHPPSPPQCWLMVNLWSRKVPTRRLFSQSCSSYMCTVHYMDLDVKLSIALYALDPPFQLVVILFRLSSTIHWITYPSLPPTHSLFNPSY